MDSITEERSTKARAQGLVGNGLAFFIAIALFAFLYLFFDVFILAFSSVLVAVLLTLLGRPFKKRLHMQNWAALMLAGLLLVAVIGAGGYLFGTRLALDIQNIVARMEAARRDIHIELKNSPLGSLVLSHLGSNGISVTQIVASIFSISANLIAGVVVSVIAGVYFAAHPTMYLSGFLALFPPARRPEAEAAAKDVGNALCLWLEGQFMSMLLVGLLSAAATSAIGLPSPLALGLIAGIAEFIPYVGPVIAAIPAVLVAATQGTDQLLWTLAAYLAIHTAEGNVIAPLIQRQMVYIPPAVMILGIAAIGFIFGPVAVIFAAPMTVVLFVLIKKLYVRDFLHEQTAIPGEQR
jgi:predicted PurR-regulated permease PerM